MQTHYSFVGDVLVRHTPLSQFYDHAYKDEEVIDKETFLLCFNKWVKSETDILDKITAEIEEVYKAEEPNDHNWAMGLRHSLKIINKYKKSLLGDNL